MAANPTPAPTPPENVYGVFCGDINAANTQKLVQNLTIASNLIVKNVHILFQSWGGFIGDGVFLYNLLKTFPVSITLYNAGQVSSAGVLAFLGGKHRKTTKNAMFMIHKSQAPQQAASLQQLQMMERNLILDDARIDTIFRENLRLPDVVWVQLVHHDINISGEDAIKYGIAQEIGEFSPPSDAKIFNALAQQHPVRTLPLKSLP
jgi:ATP-dependent protease ClpP protease subunit